MAIKINEFFSHEDFSNVNVKINENNSYFTIIITDSDNNDYALTEDNDLIYINDYEKELVNLFQWFIDEEDAQEALDNFLSSFDIPTFEIYGNKITSYSICEVFVKTVVAERKKVIL